MSEIIRWEYRFLSTTWDQVKTLGELNELGDQGWEVAAAGGAGNGYFLLKRPKSK